ncbi:MAG: CarD family transcriptional regulator [Clostridiales bacterium]|jgi:CarD family transcriptional regulator|nr:CarD family transcriptional regulator [Clostridiales bacterium]
MFCKGDKIVYPIHGAGVIEKLERQEIDGAIQTMYVLRIPVVNLTIKIAANNAESLGVRPIYTKEEIMNIIQSVSHTPIDMPDNWNQRYKLNMERIKSGKLMEVAVVFRNLLLRERERGLSAAEKKMLTTAKQIILSELILANDTDRYQAEELLINMFNENIS